MPDAHANFAVSTVATAPSPATSGTSLVVASGHGSRFPAGPFNATVWPSNASPDPSNAEIVRVTAISTDTLTITRAQESSTARSIVVGDRIAATITAKTLTDAEGPNITFGTGAPSGGSDGDVHQQTVNPYTLYRKVAGSWVKWLTDGPLFGLQSEKAALNSAPWDSVSQQTISTNASSATVAQLFDGATTGLTKSGSNLVASAADAYSTPVKAGAIYLSFRITALPPAGQTLAIGGGVTFGGGVGFPRIVVNNAGTAILSDGNTIKTFSRTVVANGNGCIFYVVAYKDGPVMVSQRDADYTGQDQALGIGDNFGLPLAFGIKGYGTVSGFSVGFMSG